MTKCKISKAFINKYFTDKMRFLYCIFGAAIISENAEQYRVNITGKGYTGITESHTFWADKKYFEKFLKNA